MKALRTVGTFTPKSERDFDDILEEWEDRIRVMGSENVDHGDSK